MAKRYSNSDIHNLSDRSVFFDANILIYIFWPSGSYRWEESYSSFFSNLYKLKNKMVIDFSVISEVVNRAVRSEHEKYLQENGIDRNDLKYKKFRDSDEGQSALNDIYQIIDKKILNIFDVAGKAFSKADITSLLKVDKLDFIDKGIEALCKENNFVLLTNDRDFIDSELEILTANPALLRVS